MKGMKKHRTGSKTAHDPNSRINKSLRKWHCESIEQFELLIRNTIIEAKLSKNALMEIKKGQKDSNGYTKCWPGKHAEGTKKGKNGGQVRNCVANEGVDKLEQRLAEKLQKLKEDSGATVSSSIASVVTGLGENGMTKTQLQKRLQGYSNRQTNVKHNIKPPKASK
jgi:hypothetical protein